MSTALVRCRLCGEEDPSTVRLHGLDICEPCTRREPSSVLAEQHGIEAVWRSSFFGVPVGGSAMRFAAELQLPSSTGVEARLVPRLIWHGLIRLISPDQPTGDPTFDGSLYTRTTTPEPTRGLFGKEGVQDALLAVMARCRDNEPGFNVVWVSGDRIGIRVSRLERLDEARHTELQLATAAFALHAIH